MFLNIEQKSRFLFIVYFFCLFVFFKFSFIEALCIVAFKTYDESLPESLYARLFTPNIYLLLFTYGYLFTFVKYFV